MSATSNKGIDYGLGRTNIGNAGIRFGVIPHYDIGSPWYDSAEADYGDPSCPKCGNKANKARKSDYHCTGCKYHFDSDEAFCDTPQAFKLDDGEYKATQGGDDCDVFILESPFFTYAQFCSPCAPGACYLRNPLDAPNDGNKAYCFNHDWFESGVAPYTVYSVKTGEVVQPAKAIAA
jgi:ribosomal protein L37AE/L43A